MTPSVPPVALLMEVAGEHNGAQMKPHRWSTSVRVERGGESAFEKTCTVCGCIARDFEVWTKTLRAGVLVSASMRKVAHFKRVTDAADREWRESRPPCELGPRCALCGVQAALVGASPLSTAERPIRAYSCGRHEEAGEWTPIGDVP